MEATLAGKDEMEAKVLKGLSSRSGQTTDVSTNKWEQLFLKKGTNMGATISRKGRSNTPSMIPIDRGQMKGERKPTRDSKKALLKEQADKTKKRAGQVNSPKGTERSGQ